MYTDKTKSIKLCNSYTRFRLSNRCVLTMSYASREKSHIHRPLDVPISQTHFFSVISMTIHAFIYSQTRFIPARRFYCLAPSRDKAYKHNEYITNTILHTAPRPNPIYTLPATLQGRAVLLHQSHSFARPLRLRIVATGRRRRFSELHLNTEQVRACGSTDIL